MSEPLSDALRRLAAESDVEVIDRGGGHFQLRGQHLLVNYYPFSKKRTAYVRGTTKGVDNCSPATAVAMARNVPRTAPEHLKDSRASNSRAIRYRLLKGRQRVKCHWCDTVIDLDTSTIEHVIPLARGGLDNDNNRTLACEPCNTARGNDMPELDESAPAYTLYGVPVTAEVFHAAAKPPPGEGPPWDMP